LAKRLAEEYISDFHLAKDKHRGYTQIAFIKQNHQNLVFQELENQIDVIKVNLASPLMPKESYSLDLQYRVKLPSDDFTRYGMTKEGDANLRYWYITPAIYDGDWHY